MDGQIPANSRALLRKLARETNQRLEQQARSLRASEELLKNQQEALQQTNAEREEQAELLALRNKEVERKNREIEKARLSLEEKAEQLARISKYKSEFLAQPKRQMLDELHSFDHVLAGKKVLIVDDDVRNIFALTSMLERHQMQVLYAENGRDGIAVLQNTPDIDVVLMDVMMPEMDGYETMRAIREDSKFKSLPMIALTAKAMQGEREKCIEAGASDYITKPVDTEQLLSLLRVWLYR